MRDRAFVDSGEMERLVLMRMDLDRYEAQLIPDLQREVLVLRLALRRLVEAVQEADGPFNLEARKSHRKALRDVQSILEEHRALALNEPAVIR